MKTLGLGASCRATGRGGRELVILKRHRPAYPKGPLPGALALLPPNSRGERATFSAIPGSVMNRPAVASGGLRARRGIFPVVEGDRSLCITTRLQPGSDTRRDLAESLKTSCGRGLVHAPEYWRSHEQRVAKSSQGVACDYS